MPRVDTEVLARREDVARRYLQGQTQSEIAGVFGVSQAQISKDLAAIRAAWLASAVRDFDAAKAQELAKIDTVEREYWLAWERSKKDKETEYSEDSSKGFKSGKRREGQAGNPAFLAGVLTCIERRCAILGLDAPKRFVIDWDNLTPEQEERLAKGEPPEKVLSA
jgi:transcriptional regulator with XRE-family HTH domain